MLEIPSCGESALIRCLNSERLKKILHGNKKSQGLESGGGLLQRDKLEGEERNRPIIR